MKYLFILFGIPLLAACSSSSYEAATDPHEAGREFIRATLDGDHKKARFYLLKDSTNLLLIERQQRDYEQLSHEDKLAHRQSDIRPVSIQPSSDSTTVFRYYNTYNPKDTTSITIVREGKYWLVDLKSILSR